MRKTVQTDSSKGGKAPLIYTLPSEETASILTMAVEGPALTEWAQIQGVERDAENNVIRFQVRADNNGPEYGLKGREWVLVDHDSVVAGAFALLTGKVKVGRSIAAQFAGDLDVDMVGIDAIVQIACFGDVIYS